jgi:hypothetical protein
LFCVFEVIFLSISNQLIFPSLFRKKKRHICRISAFEMHSKQKRRETREETATIASIGTEVEKVWLLVDF